MTKQFKLLKEQIKPIAEGFGSCIATDKITVEGHVVRFMYREKSDNQLDSGWRFMSGFEDEEYMNDANNLAIYDVNTIANYDPSIIPFLASEVGAVFEKTLESKSFVPVDDWTPKNN